jgi:hypothetical protein
VERDNTLGYSPKRKVAFLKKMLPPNTISYSRLSQEDGSSEMTLSKGRTEWQASGLLLPDADGSPEGWTGQDKFATVIETASMNETALAECRRQREFYNEKISVWREDC